MDINLLQQHVKHYLNWIKKNSELYKQDVEEREERISKYSQWTEARLQKMSEDESHEYLSPLWAMRIWGNKEYQVNKILQDNGLNLLRMQLVQLLWGIDGLASRWNSFRKNVKGIGPAMMSELLCYTHPDSCILWNRRVLSGLQYLKVPDLPERNYQLTGQKYEQLCEIGRSLGETLTTAGIPSTDMLLVDYFIWAELQLDNSNDGGPQPPDDEFKHNEIRDKLAQIGTWLGFTGGTEVKVAEGSRVDTTWEVTIGNMGRVVYVFEVQKGGSYDTLLMNLINALSNPAVQSVVAVSDKEQLDIIRKRVAKNALNDKLKYWDYRQVLKVYEALELVMEEINSLALVPSGF